MEASSTSYYDLESSCTETRLFSRFCELKIESTSINQILKIWLITVIIFRCLCFLIGCFKTFYNEGTNINLFVALND